MTKRGVTTAHSADNQRMNDEARLAEQREKMLDETIAGTFPASDPLSSLPNPEGDSTAAL